MKSKEFADFNSVKIIKVMSFAEEKVTRYKNIENENETFVKFIQIFSTRRNTKPKSFALDLYSVRAVLQMFRLCSKNMSY